MGYVVRHSTSNINKARRKGNVALGVSSDGYSKTSVSGFYAGVEPVEGKHNLVRTSASGDPDFYALTDTELINFANQLGGNATDVFTAQKYLFEQDDVISLDELPNDVVTDSLVIELDSRNESSFLDNQPTSNRADTDTKRTIVLHSPGGYGNMGIIEDAPERGPGWKKIVVQDRGSNFRIAQFPYLSHTQGEYQTYSLEYDFSNVSGYYWRLDGTSGGVGTTTDDGNKISITYDSPDKARNLAMFLNHNTTGVDNLNDVIYYRYYQVETKSKATPFTTSSRSQTTVWKDSSGNNNDATLINSPTFNSLEAIELDGVNDAVYLNSFFTSTHWVEDGDWTVSSVHRIDSNIGGNGRSAIFANQRYKSETNNGGPGGFGVNMLNGNYCMNLSHDDGEGTYNSYEAHTLIPIVTGSTVSITYTWDGNNKTAKAYKNGELISTTTNSNYKWSPRSTGLNTRIGVSTQGGWGNRFAGSIYNIKVYNDVLSQDEILQNYYGGDIVTDNLAFNFDAGNLVSYESGSLVTYNLTGSESGSLVNGAAFTSSYGGVWDLDGVNDHIDLGYQTWQFNSSTTNFSMGGWIYINSHNPANTLIQLGGAGAAHNYIGVNNSQKVVYRTRPNAGTSVTQVTSNTSINTGEWYHIFVSCDTTNAYLYINGQLDNTGTLSGMPTITYYQYIGYYRDSAYYFNGMIGPAYFYLNKALSAGEVLQNYNAHKTRFL